jgi:hypothetical protein
MNRKLNVVLIEDTDIHIKAAQQQLEDHNLIIFKNFPDFEDFVSEKLTALCQENNIPLGSQFDEQVRPISFARVAESLSEGLSGVVDVILTDNELPGTARKVESNFSLEKLGSEIVLIGVMLKVPFIGLLTDKNHHNDVYSAVFDCLGASSEVILPMNESRVLFSNVHIKIEEGKRVKNWKQLLENLVKK